ncbi:Nucleobindin-2 [Sarcoptes scabiei]|nr:Nucleobindin-2 [Sarcoptes scabiei]
MMKHSRSSSSSLSSTTTILNRTLNVMMIAIVTLIVISSMIDVVENAPRPPILNANQQKTEIEEDVNKIHDDDTVDKEIDDLGLEYGRYLQEIVKVLDEDPVFAKKLENVTHEQIMSGHVAGIIDQVAPEIRSRLDELKRVEMERLRKLLAREHKLEEEMEDEQHRQKIGDDDSVAAHIDHSNPHSFEAEDLQKLILKATKDLDELDKKRRRDFKQYEMEKEIQYQESLQNMTAEQKAEAIKHHDEIKKKHSEHPKVHHPGSKQQLEEVWEEQDHLPKQEFDPKVFYQMHDINGDGFLDQEEVEALLGLEVKKLYNEKDSTYDRNEMMEEYHRMREQMYQEIDANHDGLISRKEFLDYTKNEDFNKDEEWKGIEEEPVYTPEELKRYEQERRQLQEHYARYGAYQQQHQYQVDPAHGPYQNVYYQQVPVQQHPGQQHPQEVYVVQHPPQHVQSVQYHHVELPSQHIQQQQYHPQAPVNTQQQQYPQQQQHQQPPQYHQQQQQPPQLQQQQQHPPLYQQQQHPSQYQQPQQQQQQQQPHPSQYQQPQQQQQPHPSQYQQPQQQQQQHPSQAHQRQQQQQAPQFQQPQPQQLQPQAASNLGQHQIRAPPISADQKPIPNQASHH